MEKATTLLFETPFNGHSLFKNQQDLVVQIMQQPGTEYYVSSDDIEKYNRTLNRLKAYVSQLLSSSVVRNITPDFESVLRQIVQKKTGDTERADSIVAQIIEELKSKRIASAKTDVKSNTIEQLIADFKNGQYISIITAKPLEVEADFSNEKFSLRKLVFEDFIESIISSDRELKDYRFNFPVESSGMLFWKGLNKMLIRYLKNAENRNILFSSLKHKINLEIETNSDLFNQSLISDMDIYPTSEKILRAFRRECKIAVFTCEAPIYTFPLIVIDPAETKNAKIYAIIDSNNDNFSLHKFSNEEIVLWRLFVWDKIKSQKFSGKLVEFDEL